MKRKETLERAIHRAIAGGWKNEEGYSPIFVPVADDGTGYTFLIKDHVPHQYMFDVAELIFDHDFNKALWGNDEVDNHGWSVKAIRLWANQVAVKHGETIYDAEPEKRFGAIAVYPEIDWQEALEQPDALVNVNKVEYELKRMTASIPFETHRMETLEIESDTQTAWQYHIQQMVIADDPIEYLGSHLPGDEETS